MTIFLEVLSFMWTLPFVHTNALSPTVSTVERPVLCLSNISLTIFSHRKGNSCCVTRGFSCCFNSSLEHTASSHRYTITLWRHNFIIFACVLRLWTGRTLQRIPVSLFYHLPHKHCLRRHCKEALVAPDRYVGNKYIYSVFTKEAKRSNGS